MLGIVERAADAQRLRIVEAGCGSEPAEPLVIAERRRREDPGLKAAANSLRRIRFVLELPGRIATGTLALLSRAPSPTLRPPLLTGPSSII
jgi:hypothetical protein